MYLCKPCAVDLSKKGKMVKVQPGRSEKNDCGNCGRRRFCLPYEVTDPPKNRKGDKHK